LSPGSTLPRLPVLLSVLLLVGFSGCGEGDKGANLYLLAAGALGPEAHQDRTKVVNPFLLAPDNPRLPGEALAKLLDAGYETMEDEGQEDPGKATLYFTPLEELGEDRYRLRIHVSLGARFGTMHRGDTWWLVEMECREECRVLEITATSSPGWGRRSPVR
jgi:hypothetical protein